MAFELKESKNCSQKTIDEAGGREGSWGSLTPRRKTAKGDREKRASGHLRLSQEWIGERP